MTGFDASTVAQNIRKAMAGFGTDERALTKHIAPLDAFQVGAVKKAFETLTGKNLIREVESEVSGYYEWAVRAKLLGPVFFDCWVLNNIFIFLINRATNGAGTDEQVLSEVLLDRTNDEIRTLKAAYQHLYGKNLEAIIRSELSGKTERLFTMALAGNREPDGYVDPARVNDDVQKLYRAGVGKVGTDEITISNILVTRSSTHLRAVVQTYKREHGQLSHHIQKEFSGHMEDALLYIALGYENDGTGVHRDVELIENSMKGFGTKDERLIMRIIRAHWNRPRFQAIKQAYQQTHGKSLERRVKSETSGDYENFMVAIIDLM
ncbi:hypothetical protein M422DRAFT_45131 [Sphaerobolus stellatus SS14]|nr:hypothetical protein M422DRAFT_45131 [Sphaerobolus stellatus SS14]